MFLDWLWKKEQPLYIYYKKRVPSYYGLCGFKYTWEKVQLSDHPLFYTDTVRKLKRDGYIEFYRSTYSIKDFTFDTRGNMVGFVADDC